MFVSLLWFDKSFCFVFLSSTEFVKLIISVSTIYILGVFWLGSLIGWDKPIIQLGVTPFLLAELFKIIILTLLANNIVKLKKII